MLKFDAHILRHSQSENIGGDVTAIISHYLKKEFRIRI